MGIFQDIAQHQIQQPQNIAAQPQNMMQAFSNFMQAMQGRNPQQVLDSMLSSGKLPQGALQQAQQMARQFEPMLKGFFR